MFVGPVGELLPPRGLVAGNAEISERRGTAEIGRVGRRILRRPTCLRLFHALQELPRLPLGAEPDLAGAAFRFDVLRVLDAGVVDHLLHVSG
jgi:hypothetical protein